MNIFFAAISLLTGMAGAGVAMLWKSPAVLAAAASSEAAMMGGGPVLPSSLASANKYQLYLFVSEFLWRSKMTRNLTSDTELSDYEFYRIIYKLVKPMTAGSKAEKKEVQGQQQQE